MKDATGATAVAAATKRGPERHRCGAFGGERVLARGITCAATKRGPEVLRCDAGARLQGEVLRDAPRWPSARAAGPAPASACGTLLPGLRDLVAGVADGGLIAGLKERVWTGYGAGLRCNAASRGRAMACVLLLIAPPSLEAGHDPDLDPPGGADVRGGAPRPAARSAGLLENGLLGELVGVALEDTWAEPALGPAARSAGPALNVPRRRPPRGRGLGPRRPLPGLDEPGATCSLAGDGRVLGDRGEEAVPLSMMVGSLCGGACRAAAFAVGCDEGMSGSSTPLAASLRTLVAVARAALNSSRSWTTWAASCSAPTSREWSSLRSSMACDASRAALRVTESISPRRLLSCMRSSAVLLFSVAAAAASSLRNWQTCSELDTHAVHDDGMGEVDDLAPVSPQSGPFGAMAPQDSCKTSDMISCSRRVRVSFSSICVRASSCSMTSPCCAMTSA